MRKLAFAIIVLLFAVGLGFAPPASAYRVNNSTWNDYNFVWWTGVPNGQVAANSDNNLRATAWFTTCNKMSWSGWSFAYAPGSSSTYLGDYWSASGLGSISFSVPPSVGTTSSGATWGNSVGGDYNAHSYSSYPITFQIGTWFYSINHSVSSMRYVGGLGYNGPSFQRYEWVC